MLRLALTLAGAALLAGCDLPPRQPPAARAPAEAGVITPEQEGERLWRAQLCVHCHSLDGTPKSGPSLQHAFTGTAELADGTSVPRDEAYVRESILRPNEKITKGYPPVMPAYDHRLVPPQLDAILSYMRSRTGGAMQADASPQP